MRVDLMEEEERRAKKLVPPIDPRLPEHYRHSHHYHGVMISHQCQRGSVVGHNKCLSEQWCECPCHTACYDMM